MDRKGKEVLTQIFSVTGFLYSPFKDCWRCEKVYSDLCHLDIKLGQFHA
jgi:hypothetical protein